MSKINGCNKSMDVIKIYEDIWKTNLQLIDIS